MREILSTTEEAQDECFPSLSAATESPGSPAHGHVLCLAIRCQCLHWAKQNLTNNCVCAAGWERVQRLCADVQTGGCSCAKPHGTQEGWSWPPEQKEKEESDAHL